MNRQDAQTFFREHSEWLANSWGMSPEGRKYKARFDAAVAAVTNNDPPPAPDAYSWEIACADILRQPRGPWQTPSPYLQAVRMTRNTFGCSLMDSKNRVDALRASLGLNSK